MSAVDKFWFQGKIPSGIDNESHVVSISTISFQSLLQSIDKIIWNEDKWKASFQSSGIYSL